MEAETGEYAGPRLEGIVRQLRQRANEARRRSEVVYRFLIFVVLLGFVFYLGLPFLRDLWDGRRLALRDSIAASETTLADLDSEVAALVPALADEIAHSAVRVALPDDLPGEVWFSGISEEIADGRLIIGDEATLLRYDPTEGRAVRVALPDDLSGLVWFLGISEEIAGGRLIIGDEATLLRYDPLQGRAVRVALPDDLPGSVEFYGISEDIAGGRLIWGDEATLLRYEPTQELAAEIRTWDPFSEAKARDIAPEVAMGAMVHDLDARFQHDDAIVDETYTNLTDIAGRRQAVNDIISQANSDLESFWYGILQLDKQKQDFAEFMATCRGAHPDRTDVQMPPDGLDSDPDGVTTACVAAWQAQVNAEAGSWWKTLAVQVPPGILLLFLLATLGGLYRYNLRLAGFHSSRADALELLVEAGGFDADTLARVSEALAADKVEFGKENTPADQATEIAKAMAARK